MPDALTDSPLCDGDPLARELAALLPATTAVTPASVLFAAGEQAALARDRHWRTAAIGLGVLFVGSWIGMAVRTEAQRPVVNQASPAPSAVAVHESPPSAPARLTELPRPTPQHLAMEPLTPDDRDVKMNGLRLRHDILAGGLGLIPTDLNDSLRRLPSTGFADLNPTVLGGYYRPKDDTRPPE